MVFIDTSHGQAAIKAAQSGCPGRAVGTGDTETETSAGWWQRPSHQWLLLPSVLTGSERCLVASAPYQTLAVAVLPGICFPGNAAVQTCVLGDPPAGIFFFSIYLFCAYSQGFELFVRSVFKADEGPKQPSSPCLWF